MAQKELKQKLKEELIYLQSIEKQLQLDIKKLENSVNTVSLKSKEELNQIATDKIQNLYDALKETEQFTGLSFTNTSIETQPLPETDADISILNRKLFKATANYETYKFDLDFVVNEFYDDTEEIIDIHVKILDKKLPSVLPGLEKLKFSLPLTLMAITDYVDVYKEREEICKLLSSDRFKIKAKKNTFQISACTESIDILFSCDWHIVWVDFLQKYTHSYEIISRPVKTDPEPDKKLFDLFQKLCNTSTQEVVDTQSLWMEMNLMLLQWE